MIFLELNIYKKAEKQTKKVLKRHPNQHIFKYFQRYLPKFFKI